MRPEDWPPLTTIAGGLLVMRGAFALWQDVKRITHRVDAAMENRAGQVSADVRKRIA